MKKIALYLILLFASTQLTGCYKQDYIKVQYNIECTGEGITEIALDEINFKPISEKFDTTLIIPVNKGNNYDLSFRLKNKTERGQFSSVNIVVIINNQIELKDSIQQRDCYDRNNLFYLLYTY